jgi:hypothetical protein
MTGDAIVGALVAETEGLVVAVGEAEGQLAGRVGISHAGNDDPPDGNARPVALGSR